MKQKQQVSHRKQVPLRHHSIQALSRMVTIHHRAEEETFLPHPLLWLGHQGHEGMQHQAIHPVTHAFQGYSQECLEALPTTDKEAVCSFLLCYKMQDTKGDRNDLDSQKKFLEVQNPLLFIINLHLHIHVLQFLWDGTLQRKKNGSVYLLLRILQKMC